MLSSMPLSPTWYYPPALLSCVLTSRPSVAILLLIAAITVVSVASVVPRSAPAVPHFVPLPSLDLPPAPLRPPPPSLRILRLPALPFAPPPPALAANIDRKDKDVSDRTGGSEARWSNVSGSAPWRKSPKRPLAAVGDSTSRPLFLHRPQQ